MKTSSIAAVALKVLSVYLVLQFLAFLPALVTIAKLKSSEDSVEDGSFNLSLIVYAITAVAYLAVAMVLFCKAPKIGLHFAGRPDEDLLLSNPLSDEVLALAFRCLGVYALITWAPSLLESLSKAVITVVRSPEPVSWIYTFFWMNLVTPFTGCVIGLLLVFRTETILRIGSLSRARPDDDKCRKEAAKGTL